MPSTPRTILLAVAASLLVAPLAAPASAAGAYRVDAELGSLDAFCGDDGPMTVHQAFDNSGQVVFHPSSGCFQRFNFSSTARLSVTTIRYYLGGVDGVICGSFVVSGSVLGASPVICAPHTTWIVAPVASVPVGTGEYTITWVSTDDVTPSWVNAHVDYHIAVNATP